MEEMNRRNAVPPHDRAGVLWMNFCPDDSTRTGVRADMNFKILARPVCKVCGYPYGVQQMSKILFPCDTDLSD